MNENENQNLSALEKVKKIKEQKEQERKEAEELIKKQELEKVQNAEARYAKLQNDLVDLELQKKDLESQMKDKKREKVSIRKSQEAATAEIFSDKDVVEEVFQGDGTLENNQTLKDIFAEDEEKVSSIDKTIKELKDQIKVTEESIETTKLQAQETYKETPKGIEEIEKQKAEQEAAEKAEQERIKKEEREKINQVLGVNIKRQSADFFKTGQVNIHDYSLKKANQEFGAEKVKETFNELIDEQIQDSLNAEREKWGVNELKFGIERFDTALELHNKYKKEYSSRIVTLMNNYEVLKEVARDISKTIPEIKIDNLEEQIRKKAGLGYQFDDLNNYRNNIDKINTHKLLEIDSISTQNDSLLITINALRNLLNKAKNNTDAEDFKINWKQEKFGDKIEMKEISARSPYDNGYDTIKFNAFDKDRYQQLGYQGVNEYDKAQKSRIEKTATIDQARQLLKEGEEKVAAKEKAMKEVANAQFEQQQLIIEARSKLKIPDNYIMDLESQFSNYEARQRTLKTIYSQILQKSAQLESMKDAEIANHGGSIIFKYNKELNTAAKETDKQLTQEKDRLTTERFNLQNEISKATLGFGNKAREKRIAEIDLRINEINQEKTKLESEVRGRSTYMEIGQILKDLNIDSREIMDGIRTAGELMKKLQDKVLEDQQIPFDSEKKEYIGKLRNAQNLVDQKKRNFVDMNSR